MSDTLDLEPGDPDPSEVVAAPGAEGAPAPRRRVAPFVSLALALVLGALVVVFATAKKGERESAATPLIGQAAPDVKGTGLDGHPFDLATRRGSWVALNFFSVTCTPCVQEHPQLVQFSADQQARSGGAELVTVVYSGDQLDRVTDFLNKAGGSWPVVPDVDGQIAVAYGIAKVPETWIIDPNGVVRERIISTVTASGLADEIAHLQAA
jgi:cytochrome c biogenesis protein CcmG/thiol:disulfide interchange protein DsbE